MSFFELFEASNFQPILYQNKKIQLSDDLPWPTNKKIKLNIESAKSEWEQGIIFNSKGAHFKFNDSRESLNSLLIWQTEVPIENNIIIVKPGKRVLKVWNMWRIDGGPTSYGHNGAAIHIEEIKGGRRYYCNDGYPDDDFDDLVFSIFWSV